MNKDIIRRTFENNWGEAPEIIVRAPGRINLIGEHTDYNAGFVMPAAIDKAIWLAASKREDGQFVFFASDLNEQVASPKDRVEYQDTYKWANYILGAISEARKAGADIDGFNLAFGGDVPLGAGLSSSAALESGVLFLLNELFSLGFSKMEIVRLAQRGENNFVGMKCGIMDMFASVMGRENHLIKLDCRNLEYAYYPFDTRDHSLVLLDSGVKHALVESEYNTRREECEHGVALLKKIDPTIESLRDVSYDFLQTHRAVLPPVVYQRCEYVITEINRVEQACLALQTGDMLSLGQLMYETHTGLSQSYAVSIPEIDFLVNNAQFQGAVGARMMGGGFGGCTINLLKTNELDLFQSKMTAAYKMAYSLELKTYPVQLSDGISSC